MSIINLQDKNLYFIGGIVRDKILGKENEYSGYMTMYYEYNGRDIEVEYSVWYKAV